MNMVPAPAATPAAPAASPVPVAPGPSEAAINQNPINTSNPVGQQAGDAPVGDLKGGKGRPESRREIIARAFQRAAGEPVTPRAKAPEAKAAIGHNQPPEATEPSARDKQREREERRQNREHSFDLRQPPSARDNRKGDRPRQQRGDHGHFASANPQLREQQPQRPTVQLPANAPYRMPLQRMGEHAKREWSSAPESVRGEVYRMQNEFNQYYQRTKEDRDTMESIRDFHNLAKQHGTSLRNALSNYVGMENRLRSDPIGGLDVIVNNLNLRTPPTQEFPQGQRITLRDIAWHVLNQSPEQIQAMQTHNAQNSQSVQIGQLHQMVTQLAQNQQALQYERQFTHTRSEVDRFAETHPRLDELAPAIEQELKLGFDLNTAYRRADLLYPATHAAQTRNPTAQTRTADRSISGAPDGGLPSAGARQRANGKAPSRREAIASAIRRVNGSL